MPQVSKPVQMMLVDHVCDKCNSGMMRPNGNNMMTSNPPQFEHKCTECDHTQAFAETFPTTGFQLIPEVEESIKQAHANKQEQAEETQEAE